MDVWTTLWADGTFNIARFVASITTAAPYTVVYMDSNVIFLMLLTKPIGSKIQRLKERKKQKKKKMDVLYGYVN